ncbi:MAG: hypothetical protein WKF54_06540 [Nocardioidaceae bacterium]
MPEHDLAVCLLANGDVQGLLRDQFVSGVLDDMLGISRPSLPAPVTEPVDPSPFLGSYRRSEQISIDVRASGDALVAAFVTSGEVATHIPSFTTPLTYAGGTTFLLTLPPMTERIAATFLYEDDDAGSASHLALGTRVAPRV